MKLLYIGNKLSSKGQTPTTIDTLSTQFKEFANVVTASDKKNKFYRLIDMCWHVLKNQDADYVLIDTYSTSAFYFTLCIAFLCKILNLKYIPILHGGDLGTRLGKSPKLSKFIFDNAFHLVSPSGYLYSEFKSKGYVNITIIPNNIDINSYKFTPRKSVRPRLLWVRAFANIYNCHMAIRVVKDLLQNYPDASLCMVGPDRDGSMEKIKKLVVENGITDSVKFTGKLSKQEWHTLSEDYDIFISTTNFDNTPVSVIEAMALGLPCVLTNVGGVPYLVDDGKDSILVDKNDNKQMVDAIVHLINSPEHVKSICANARAKVESFDWQVCKRQWQKLLQSNK